MRSLRYTLCDVFTSTPLTGNALAVFTGAEGLTDQTLQSIAREMNLSETVFVYRSDMPEAQAKLRIFTPSRELPFAGHPVVGAAAVIGRTITVDVLTLETGKGLVPLALGREGAEVRSARMLQPLPTREAFGHVDDLLGALGVEAAALPVELYDNGPRHVMVALDDVENLRNLRPDMGRLSAVHDQTTAVFARSGTGLEARVFAPEVGVSEDPATGSAAGPLALHAVRHGWARAQEQIEIAQGLQIDRPSLLRAWITMGPNDAPEKVEVEGDVVLVGKGELKLPIFG